MHFASKNGSRASKQDVGQMDNAGVADGREKKLLLW